MIPQPLDARVRHRAGAAVIDLRGDIDAAAEATLQRAYADAEAVLAAASDPAGAPSDAASAAPPEAPPVVLNFREVGYINSTGIALLVALLTRARGSGRRLRVCGLSEHYQEIFAITRLSDFMAVFPDETSALAAPAAG